MLPGTVSKPIAHNYKEIFVPHEVSYYLKTNWGYRFLLGAGRPNFFRFIGILVAWYLLAFIICAWKKALIIPGDDIGLLEDLVMYSLIFVLPAIVFLSINLLIRLEAFFASMIEIIVGCSNDMKNVDVSLEIEKIREFVSLRTRLEKKWYVILSIAILVLIYFFQVHIPIFIPQNKVVWAIGPRRFPVLFIFAICWALFYWGIIICNAIWFAVSISFSVFPLLHRFSKTRRIQVLPVAPDGRGGLAPIGSLSFSVILLISVGLIVVVAWVLIFGADLPLIGVTPTFVL